MIERKSNFCCLSAINETYTVDVPYDVYNEDFVSEYQVEWTTSYRTIRSKTPKTSYNSCLVEQILLESGEYAFPVYEVTSQIDEDTGEYLSEEMHLAGWCIKKENPFYSLPNVLFM